MLRQLGHDVLTTQAADRRGAPDDDQIAFAAASGRAIFTHDVKDYGRLASEWATTAREHSGIVVSEDVSPTQLRAWFLALFELYPDGIANLYLQLPLAK